MAILEPRVVTLTRGDEKWDYTLPETESDQHARKLIDEPLGAGFDAVVDQNGGGWKISEMKIHNPEERNGDN